VTPDPASALDNRDDVNRCSQGILTSDGVTPCVPAADCVGGFLSDGTTACVIAPAFTYMGEQMALNFALTAQNLAGGTTHNYAYSATAANNFAKLDPQTMVSSLGIGAVDTAAPTYLSARVDTSLTGSGHFSGGNAIVSAPIKISRAASPDGPYAALSIGINPVDSDGVALAAFDLDTDATAGDDHALIGSTELRYGRLRLQNAYGSELLDLPLSFKAEYWDGMGWALNSLDTDTTLTAGLTFTAVGTDITSYTCVLEPANVSAKGCGAALTGAKANRAFLQGGVSGTDSNGVAGFAGNFNLWLKAPGSGHAGAINVTGTAPTWLQYVWSGSTLSNPTARATFGIYGGGASGGKNPIIYRRENY
jgi:MSHA biogenesis protein MshQ